MKANTPLEQICINTKDIKRLKEIIAGLYKCSVDLGTTSTSTTRSNTNLPVDLEKAYIVDTKGNLYKLMGYNEDKTIIYLEYYTNIKGEKGDTGATGANGQDGQDGQNGAMGYSIHYSSEDFDEGTDEYDLTKVYSNTTIVANDVVLFANGYLVVIYSVGETTYETANGTMVKLQMGKQLYQHNIDAYISGNTQIAEIKLSIINDSDEAFNITSLTSYLKDVAKKYYNGSNASRVYPANGACVDLNANHNGVIIGIFVNTSLGFIQIAYKNSSTYDIYFANGVQIRHDDIITL